MNSCSMQITEDTLTGTICEYFTKLGCFVIDRLRLNPAEIDILLLEPITLKLISIEVKLNDWKGVLMQSKRNMLYTHYSYALLPEQTMKSVPVAEFEKRGIGLMFSAQTQDDISVDIRHHAVESKVINRVLKKNIYCYFWDLYGAMLYE